MAKGIIENGPDPRDIYSDIIDLPHHQSDHHPQMSLYDRAAQFSPFAALTGYDDMVQEEARETGKQSILEEWESDILSKKLSLISEMIASGKRPVLTITYFVPDSKKSGGEYVTITEEIKRIDSAFRKVILMRTEGAGQTNVQIDIEAIADISGEDIDSLNYFME